MADESCPPALLFPPSCSYYAARKGAQLTQPPSCLPGRVLLLFRVQQADAAGAELEAAGKQTAVEGAASGSSKGSNDCKASGSSTEPRWEAAWLEGEELAARGICVSRFSLSDHYVSRLLGVLGDLAPGGTSPTTLDAMNGAA